MATKKEELTFGSTLQDASDDEPLFILRAQDRLAPTLVALWADMLETVYGVQLEASGSDGLPGETVNRQLAKVEEARALAVAMDGWQMAHGSKIPD